MSELVPGVPVSPDPPAAADRPASPDASATAGAAPSTGAFGGPPRLYRGRSGAVPGVTAAGRLSAFALAAGCLAVLVVAAGLRPSPTGVGSHRGLGLQSCELLDRTGVPCPTCGMTTSFTWFARGNLVASAYVQPMGTALATAAACGVWAGLYVAVTGRPVHRLLTLFPASRLLFGVLAFAILAWGWKIFLRLRGLDGWG